jgi:hypothetical protein
MRSILRLHPRLLRTPIIPSSQIGNVARHVVLIVQFARALDVWCRPVPWLVGGASLEFRVRQKSCCPPPSVIKFYVCRPPSTTWDHYETIYGMTIALTASVTKSSAPCHEGSLNSMRLSQRRKTRKGGASPTRNDFGNG